MPQNPLLEVSRANFRALQDPSQSPTSDLDETVEAIGRLRVELDNKVGELTLLVQKAHQSLRQSRGTVEELNPYRRYVASQIRWSSLLQHTLTKISDTDRVLKLLVTRNQEAEKDLKRRASEKRLRDERRANQKPKSYLPANDDDFTVLLGEFE